MVIAVVLGAVAPALAQDPPADSAETDTQVFEAAYFAVFNPVTAADMVRQVPGFSIDNGEQLRGFGATAGNVLINGARLTTKNGVSNELARIAASRVVRIELLRGGSNSADVRGRTSMVNVVLTEDEGASTTYALEGWLQDGGRLNGSVQATRTFAIRGVEVTLDARLQGDGNRNTSDEVLLGPNDELIEDRNEFFQGHYRETILSGSATWRPTAQDTISANARGSRWRWHGYDVSDARDADGDPIRIDIFDNEEIDTQFFEFGGDWEHTLGPRTSFKLVGLSSYWEWASPQTFDRYFATGGVTRTVVNSPGSRGERVARGTFSWRTTDNLTLEIGAETAFNFRDTNLRITTDNGSGPVDVPLQVAVTRVEELRGEAFTTAIWQVAPDLKLEGGFNFEASRISQSGDAEQERELTYPKPRLIATYDFDEDDQIRLSLTREVGQLDFSDFAASVQLTDNTSNAGNPDLEPDRSWRARAEWQRQISPRAAFTLAGFYDAVEGVQDLVVLNGFTGPGNLGDGVRWGGSIQGSAPLDPLGLTGALLKIDATVQETSVEDPVTGEDRPFSNENDWFARLEFRQDLPARQFAWGWTYNARAERPYYRLDELSVFDPTAGNLFAFVETTRWAGVTLRLSAQQPFEEHNERTFFQGTRASEIVTGRELRDKEFGTFYGVRVSGAF